MSQADQTLSKFRDEVLKEAAFETERQAHQKWLGEFEKHAADLSNSLRHLLDVELDQRAPLCEVDPDPSSWPLDIVRASHAIRAMGLIEAIPTNAPPWEQFRYDLIRDAANGAQPREIMKSLTDARRSGLLKKGTWQYVFNALNALVVQMQRTEESKRFPRLFRPMPVTEVQEKRHPVVSPYANDKPKYAMLRSCIVSLKLRGNQAKLIDEICTSEAGVNLADLRTIFDWNFENTSNNWNSMRSKLNKKLKDKGWLLYLNDQVANARQIPVTRTQASYQT